MISYSCEIMGKVNLIKIGSWFKFPNILTTSITTDTLFLKSIS